MEMIIKNGTVFNGTAEKPKKVDVAINNGKIEAVGPGLNMPAGHYIDASGLYVSPGFIDMHSHCDFLPLLTREVRYSRIEQGITTDLAGQCGTGPAPYIAGMEDWRRYISSVIGDPPDASWNWPRFGDFLDDMELNNSPHHIGYLAAHGALRSFVMGLSSGKAGDGELHQMGKLLREALESGAFGLSFGLSYLPGMYADKREITYLAHILKEYEAVFMVHIRSHSVEIENSLAEMFQVAEDTGVKMHISHLKSYQDRAYGIAGETLRQRIENAFADRKLDVSYDEHPYSAGSTSLSQLLPPWVREGGNTRMLERLKNRRFVERLRQELADPSYTVPGWDNFSAIAGWDSLVISATVKEQNKIFEGLSLRALGQHWQMDVVDALMRFIKEEGGASCMIMAGIFSDEDLAELLDSPAAYVGSDGIPTGTPHPRLFGTFPLFLRKTVRERQVFSWEDALHMITGKAAERLELPTKGHIMPAYDADLVVFDPDKIDVEEDYNKPCSKPRGIEHVVVGGKEALGTCQEAGKVLRFG